jgi:hypothetical protein
MVIMLGFLCRSDCCCIPLPRQSRKANSYFYAFILVRILESIFFVIASLTFLVKASQVIDHSLSI